MEKENLGNWFIIGALVCAVIAGMLAFGLARTAAPTYDIYIAREAMEPGDRLDAENVAVKQVPRAAVPDNAVSEEELNDGWGKHVKTYIGKGDPIRKEQLAEMSGNGGTVAARLTVEGEDLLGVALPSEASEGLNVEVGDKVDIIGVIDIKSGQEKIAKSSKIAKNAPVIDVSGKESGSGDLLGSKSSITIAVTEGEADTIALYLKKGDVLAVLVAYRDQDTEAEIPKPQAKKNESGNVTTGPSVSVTMPNSEAKKTPQAPAKAQ
ncbi:MAG: Flp pilus assembly protein CpaB [Candidatus Saccharibacteria bacterium]